MKELQTHYFIACWLVVLSETESLSVLQKEVCGSEDAKIVQTALQGPPAPPRLSALKPIHNNVTKKKRRQLTILFRAG